MEDERWEKWVASRLKGEHLHEPPSETIEKATALVEEQRPAPRRWFPAGWGLAAAALLVMVVAAGWYFRQLGPPGLPDRTSGSAVRGARVTGLSPVGEVGAAPSSLRWSTHEGAERYRVRLFTVDDRILWEGDSTEDSIELPAEVRAGLFGAVAYQWQVEALDADDRVLASSERVQFRLAP